MATITATAYGMTFTRRSEVAWTHATITQYSNGYTGINWAKSHTEAAKLADRRNDYIATLTAAERTDSAYPTRATVVQTTITI